MDAVPRLDPRNGRVIPPDFLVPQEPERYTAAITPRGAPCSTARPSCCAAA